MNNRKPSHDSLRLFRLFRTGSAPGDSVCFPMRWSTYLPGFGGDGEIRTLARCLDAYRISSPAPKRIFRKRAGQSWSVCPRIFGGVKPFSRARSPKNGFGTNQTGIPRFGPVWQDFLEKCKISCKIIEGRFAG